MYVGGGVYLGEGRLLTTHGRPRGRLFGRGIYLREGRLFEQIRYLELVLCHTLIPNSFQ